MDDRKTATIVQNVINVSAFGSTEPQEIINVSAFGTAGQWKVMKVLAFGISGLWEVAGCIAVFHGGEDAGKHFPAFVKWPAVSRCSMGKGMPESIFLKLQAHRDSTSCNRIYKQGWTSCNRSVSGVFRRDVMTNRIML